MDHNPEPFYGWAGPYEIGERESARRRVVTYTGSVENILFAHLFNAALDTLYPNMLQAEVTDEQIITYADEFIKYLIRKHS